MKPLYLSSIILSLCITLCVFFNYIYEKDSQKVFYFNKTYESDLKQEGFSLSGVLLKVTQDQGLKNAFDRGFSNSINQSLKVYKTSNIDLMLFDSDCNLISKTSDKLKNLSSLCSSQKKASNTTKFQQKGFFAETGVELTSIEELDLLIKSSKLQAETNQGYLIVVSYIDEGFLDKYQNLKSLYSELNVKIDTGSKFWAGFLTGINPYIHDRSGSERGFISSKLRLKFLPFFLFDHINTVFLVLIVLMIAFLVFNNVILILKLYKDRIKLDLDIGNFFDWIKLETSKISQDSFSISSGLFEEKSISTCKDQMSLFLENLKDEIKEDQKQIEDLGKRLKEEIKTNKTLGVQLSYYSQIESMYVQMKHLFLTIISHIEDIHDEINILNQTSKEAFVGSKEGFFTVLNEWVKGIKERGSWRFLRSLYESRSSSKSLDKTLLDDHVEKIISQGNNLYFASSGIVSRINNISQSMQKISKLFDIWQKILYEKKQNYSFSMSDVLKDSQLLISEELSLKDNSFRVEFINYNLETTSFPQISDNTWTSFLYHLYSSWLRVAEFLQRNIKIFTTFKTTDTYECIVVGTDIKDRFSQGNLKRIKDLQQNDLDLAFKIVDRYQISEMNFLVTDEISPIGFKWPVNKKEKKDRSEIKVETESKIGLQTASYPLEKEIENNSSSVKI